jgi:hypothetical protein
MDWPRGVKSSSIFWKHYPLILKGLLVIKNLRFHLNF